MNTYWSYVCRVFQLFAVKMIKCARYVSQNISTGSNFLIQSQTFIPVIRNTYSNKSGTVGKITIKSKPPSTQNCDWIGPADPVSNLRPIKFYIPTDETALQREFREKRHRIQEWNGSFWKKHNKNFIQAKENFIKTKLDQLGHFNSDGTKRTLTADEMSEFYRSFLRENHKNHLAYNWEWYKKTIGLLMPAIKCNMEKIFTKIRGTVT
ncbi:COA8 family protein CBG23705, mitochondrial-like [Tubulanus polymorphus]|uniref:COA8 family protein CBG23705, mitochondrial-like n=1 Tax=Tubulanus polymorphus TaxID=672921 RepID=UPI003DA53901